MSGKSAQEIASIVKESIKEAQLITSENKKKVEEGNAYAIEAAKILSEIMDSSQTVSAGSNQVLNASKNQALGIGQINTAISQLDKTTQVNAATAQETASSSEELNAQVESLNSVVKELREVVQGAENKTTISNTYSPLPTEQKVTDNPPSKHCEKSSFQHQSFENNDDGWADL
jgi:methyl-accepting chemotaxis protein